MAEDAFGGLGVLDLHQFLYALVFLSGDVSVAVGDVITGSRLDRDVPSI
jgi:hypothetical protein